MSTERRRSRARSPCPPPPPSAPISSESTSLPTDTGFLVVEVNGAVDFRPQYALGPGDVFEGAVAQLLRAAREGPDPLGGRCHDSYS